MFIIATIILLCHVGFVLSSDTQWFCTKQLDELDNKVHCDRWYVNKHLSSLTLNIKCATYPYNDSFANVLNAYNSILEMIVILKENRALENIPKILFTKYREIDMEFMWLKYTRLAHYSVLSQTEFFMIFLTPLYQNIQEVKRYHYRIISLLTTLSELETNNLLLYRTFITYLFDLSKFMKLFVVRNNDDYRKFLSEERLITGDFLEEMEKCHQICVSMSDFAFEQRFQHSNSSVLPDITE